MRTLAILIAAAGVLCCDAFACGIKSPGRETHPLWQAAATDNSSPASHLAYLVERVSDQLAAVTFHNVGDQELHFSFAFSSVPSSQAAPEKAALKPGAQARFEVKLDHFLSTYFIGSVDVWNVSEGAAALIDEPRPVKSSTTRLAPTGLPLMYSVYPLEESTTFNPKLLSYLIVRKPDNKVAIQFRSDARRTLRFDFRIAGFQAADEKNPRVTMFPGMEDELTVTAENAAEPDIESGLIEVWNIRIGDEPGPVISPERKAAEARRVTPFRGAALFAPKNVEFNDQSVCACIDMVGSQPVKIRLVNVGDSTVSLDPLIVGNGTVECPRAAVPSGGEVALDVKGVNCRLGHPPTVFARKVRVGRDVGPYIGEINEPRVTLQDGWLFVNVAGDAPLFNPKSIGYGVVDSTDATTVKFVNFSDSPVHFDFRLPGYQNEASGNSRISLAPRWNLPAECQISVNKKDARLSVAKVQIYNIRLGVEDEGVVLAEKPARTAK